MCACAAKGVEMRRNGSQISRRPSRATKPPDFAFKFLLSAFRTPLSSGAIGATSTRALPMSVNYTAITPGPGNAICLAADARHFQIATLAALLVLHVSWFDLGATPFQALSRSQRHSGCNTPSAACPAQRISIGAAH